MNHIYGVPATHPGFAQVVVVVSWMDAGCLPWVLLLFFWLGQLGKRVQGVKKVRAALKRGGSESSLVYRKNKNKFKKCFL